MMLVLLALGMSENGNRKKDTKLLVDAASNFDLHIYDRFYNTQNRNKFPAEYDDFIKWGIVFCRGIIFYRAYKIFLNVNSVSDSPTMFSRRVFEILASSTALISTPSIGMEEMLGNFISVVDNEDDARLTLTNLLNDDNFRNKLSHLGYREVMNNHTYRKRIEYVFDKVEIEYEQSSNPLISCITCSNRPSMLIIY